MLRRALVLAIVLYAVAVHGAAPSNNLVNKWAYDATAKKFTVSEGAATSCQADEDMFPEKVGVSFADFSVTYHKTYKIVTNKKENKQYLLTQRGCARPANSGDTATSKFAAEVEVPLRSVAVSSSTYFGAFEQIGERPAVRLYTTATLYTASPCLNKQHDDGFTLSKTQKSAWGAGLEYDSATSKWKNSGDGSEDAAVNALNIDASFAEKSNAPYLKNGIVMSDTTESTFYGAGEWTEYIALFFNKEKVVKTLVDDVRSKWLCHSANHAKQLAPNTPKPKVLFLEWQNQTYGFGTYKGWEVEACYSCSDGSYPTLGQDFDGSKWQCGLNKIPATKTAAHRYCELIRAAGGEVLNNHVLANPAVALADEATAPPSRSTNNGVEKTPFPQGPWKGPAGKGSKSGYSHADLAKVAKDADIIILKTGNCNCAWDTPACTAKQCSDYYANQVFGDASLSQIKAVRNKKVFDMYNSVEPDGGAKYVQAPGLFADVMLEDFIKAISGDMSKATAAHSLVFLRDTFKANSWGNLYKCGEAGAPSVGCAPTKASLVAKCTQPLTLQSEIVSDACPTVQAFVAATTAPSQNTTYYASAACSTSASVSATSMLTAAVVLAALRRNA